MEKIYDMVKSQYDDGMIGYDEWQEFCVATLEILMKNNQDVLSILKNI